MPELRSLYFINAYYSPWPTILPILTPSESRAIIFPDLQEVVFLTHHSDSDLECFDGPCELLRDFLLARRETLARLSIPPVKNGDVLNPLRDHTPPLEVRFTHVLCVMLFMLIVPVRRQNLIPPLFLIRDLPGGADFI